LAGEAGIGKTALLEHAIHAGPDFTLVRATGVEADMELAFAALHEVCAPLLGLLSQLPDPQRAALELTFGLSRGPAPDRFLVALAVLGLFSEASSDRPVMCVVDNANWLDPPSAETLAFVARRLMSASIVMLFATRRPSDILAGVPHRLIVGLD